jgi:glycosyltransferase involved in cell wall biosynthesis
VPSLNGGGAERAVLLLARFWPGRHRPVVILRTDEGAFHDELKELAPGQVACLGLASHGVSASLRTPLELARVVDRFNLEVVVAFLSLPSVVSLRLFRPNIGIVLSIQTPPGGNLAERGMAARVRHGAVRLVTDIAASFVDAIASPSAGTAERFAGRPFVGRALKTGMTAWHHIPNPLDPALLRKRSPRRADNSSDVPRVVTAGRLVPEKRFDLFISAIAELQKTRAVRGTIFGEGPLRGALLRQAADLGLEGKLSIEPFQHDLDSIYGKADVFVLTSDYEGFGNVIVEALAFGLPVVSTNAPFGPSEILGGGQFGLLVPCGDFRQVAAAVSSALPGGPDHERLQASAQGRAQRYAAPRIAAEMYACALEARQRRRTHRGRPL